MDMLLREATPADLPAINTLISAAVMTWNLPERVKRLSLPSYHYDQTDLQHLVIQLAETEPGRLAGIVAWEPADTRDTPQAQPGLLLHGIYVLPDVHQQGIGRQLLAAAQQAARQGGYAGLLVKAQPDAEGFFLACGLSPLPVTDKSRHYHHRYWLSVA